MRDALTAALHTDLAACLVSMHDPKAAGTDGPPPEAADPTSRTAAALETWAATCETWLWKAAGNDGPVPKKFSGRCSKPTRTTVPRPRLGKDGHLMPPRTAAASGVLRRLQEVLRQINRSTPRPDVGPYTRASSPSSSP